MSHMACLKARSLALIHHNDKWIIIKWPHTVICIGSDIKRCGRPSRACQRLDSEAERRPWTASHCALISMSTTHVEQATLSCVADSVTPSTATSRSTPYPGVEERQTQRNSRQWSVTAWSRGLCITLTSNTSRFFKRVTSPSYFCCRLNRLWWLVIYVYMTHSIQHQLVKEQDNKYQVQ
jgi:hypothetical protein